jgi:broad specificity phosphatase PhoE
MFIPLLKPIIFDMGGLYKMLGFPTGLKRDNASDRNIKGPQYKEGGEVDSESEGEEEMEEEKEKAELSVPHENKIKRSAFIYTDPHAAIYFLRHGPTAYNAENGGVDRVRGWEDVALTDKGRSSAMKAGESLKSEKIDVIVCCDLSRTRETASIVSTIIGVPVDGYTQKLRPWNLGSFQGKEVKATYPQIAWYANHPKAVVPQGESLDAFKERFLTYMSELDKRYPGKRVLVITHSRNVSMYNAWMAKGCNRKHEIDTDVFLDLKSQPKAGEVERVEYTMLNNYAQCTSCKMFISSKAVCSLHGMDVKIKGSMSCSLHAYGHADESELQHVSAAFTPQESGLVDRQVRCENCKFYCEEDSDCELFEFLNGEVGVAFALNDKVDKHGCCTAQTPKPKDT